MKKFENTQFKFAIKVSGIGLTELVVNHLYSLGYEWCSGDKCEVINECAKNNEHGIGVEHGRISYNVYEWDCDKWYDIDEYVEKYDELMEEYISIKMGLL